MGLFIRTVGIRRAEAAVTLANMAFNMKRWCWLEAKTRSRISEAASCGNNFGQSGPLQTEQSGHRPVQKILRQPITPVSGGVQVPRYQRQATGRSKGGMTTKILALTDALGNLVRFRLMPGLRFDSVEEPPLIEGVEFGALIAEKAFDSDTIVADLNERGAKIVISQHPRRAKPIPLDREMYKWRPLIENFFAKLKEFKRVAMRASKTDQNFSAMIYLAAATINGR